jgi:hypothetical protein
VHFIHLNHTNPALVPGSEAQRQVEVRLIELQKSSWSRGRGRGFDSRRNALNVAGS